MRLLRKEGKVSTRAGKVVDDSRRSCCCDSPLATLFAECCNGEPRIWVADTAQSVGVGRQCEIVKYQGKCFASVGTSPNVIKRPISELESEGISYISSFDEGEGCIELPIPGGQYSCFRSRQFKLCPECPDRCCLTGGFVDCSTDPESIKTCTLGNRYRIRTTYRDSTIYRGYSQVQATSIYDIVPPDPTEPLYTKCIGIPGDIFYLRIIETKFDGTLSSYPDPLFPDIPGACRRDWTIHSASVKSRFFAITGQFLVYTNTLILDGVDTGLPTSNSQRQFLNRNDIDDREEFEYNTIEEIDRSPYSQYFRTSPGGICTTLQDTEGDPYYTCCNGSSRFVVDLPFLYRNRQTIIRNQSDCLSGSYQLIKTENIRDCVSDLDPQPALERIEERVREGSYTVDAATIGNEYCDQPIDGPPPDGSDPSPLTLAGTVPSTMLDPVDPRKISSVVRSGCSKCRTSIGI